MWTRSIYLGTSCRQCSVVCILHCVETAASAFCVSLEPYPTPCSWTSPSSVMLRSTEDHINHWSEEQKTRWRYMNARRPAHVHTSDAYIHLRPYTTGELTGLHVGLRRLDKKIAHYIFIQVAWTILGGSSQATVEHVLRLINDRPAYLHTHSCPVLLLHHLTTISTVAVMLVFSRFKQRPKKSKSQNAAYSQAISQNRIDGQIK